MFGIHEVHVVVSVAHVRHGQLQGTQVFDVKPTAVSTATKPSTHELHLDGSEQLYQFSIHIILTRIASISVESRHFE